MGLAIRVRFATIEEFADPSALIGPATRLCWVETPINPTLRCLDVRRVAGACRERGVLSVLDNTFASPINQQPLALGVDFAMQSATKYLGGHSDVTGGVVSGTTALMEKVDLTRRFLGGVMDPQAAADLGRSLKTLAGAHGAAQRERRRRRPLPRAGPPRRRGSTTRGSRRIPTTRSRGRRCRGSAGW